jgi:hypothetical protein
MKIITIFGASALILALGTTASARGQHGDQDRQEHGRSEEHSDKNRGSSVPSTTGRTGSIARRRVGAMRGVRPAGPPTETPKRERFGRVIAPNIGNMNTMVGASAEDTGATASRTIASARILAADTGFACAVPPSWS